VAGLDSSARLNGAVLRCAPDRFRGAAKSPHIKTYLLFAWLKKFHLTAVGVSNSPNTQPIDLPNSNGDKCCAAQWHAMADQAATMSGETSRTDLIRSFGDRSDLF
jgi:hypothetical protein